MIINETSDFCRQYQYLQLKKPSGVEFEIPVHKKLAVDLLKGGSCLIGLMAMWHSADFLGSLFC